MDSPAQLIAKAVDAAQNAYAPYSHFHVGAAVQTDTGTIFSGCNVENASYGLTLCAERTAVFTAVATGHRNFSAIAIVADGHESPYPCGACRQVLAEFCPDTMPVYIANIATPDKIESTTLGTLLPKAFRLTSPDPHE